MAKRLKLVAGLAILLIFSLILVGCGDKTVATVNGEKITESELNKQLEVFSKQNGIDLKDPKFKEMVDPFTKQVLDQMVQSTIVLQEAEKRNIEVSEKDIDAEINKIVKEYFQDDKKKFNDAVKQMGMSEEFLRKDIETGIVYNKLVEQIAKEAKIADAEVKKYYNQNKEQFNEVEASHILVEKEDEAKQIIAKLKEVSADKFADEFAKLAKEKSKDDSNKATGGKLGFFGKGKMVPEFEKAASDLEVGKFTQEPVQSQFGYHVIYVTDKKMKTLEEAKAQIKETLQNEEVNKYIANLSQKAKVDYKVTFKEAPPAGMGGDLPPATGGSGQNPHESGEIPLDEQQK